ncbi:SpoIID/LytB domain-containing protein [Candidatus Daviesbacteria bacterium]|nr:SpoIID/LytB domain-containing protein [Candidatus Daviesbacteria bacterium]
MIGKFKNQNSKIKNTYQNSKFLRHFKLCIVILIFTLYILHLPLPVYADELDDIKNQINKLSSEWQQVEKAKKPLEGQLKSLELQLAQIQAGIDHLAATIGQKQNDLNLREDKLALQHALLEKRVRAYYIRSYLVNPMLVILSSINSADLFRELSFRQNIAKEDQQIITSITQEVVDLLSEKNKLEKDKARLAGLQAEVDKNASFLGGEIKKAKAYQADISKQIAQLSARQQAIIAQRQASLNLPTSLGAGPLFCSDDRKLDPGFRPAFVFFTFGIPHRVGMNQYGALGRAQAGQNHEDILRAYFANFGFEQKPNINISVAGFGSMSMETYLLGIYEMPGSWPIEALKAQAIAARSYALSYTNNGSKEICTTQSCQVYKGGNKGGNWEQAVKLTEGKTMISGGSAVTAWYSSTDGGYTFSAQDVGWSDRSFTKRSKDTNGDIGSFADLFSKAYDKDSPCFYAAQGFRSEYAKSAWLKPEEVADIANMIMLTKRDSGLSEHLYQVDKPNPEGTDTWNHDKVKEELKNRGGAPFNQVSIVSVLADFNTGMSTLVTISGDGHSETFNGSEFKNFFNLRAPANIQIVGPLFNVELK